jgi:hypothetical protein
LSSMPRRPKQPEKPQLTALTECDMVRKRVRGQEQGWEWEQEQERLCDEWVLGEERRLRRKLEEGLGRRDWSWELLREQAREPEREVMRVQQRVLAQQRERECLERKLGWELEDELLERLEREESQMRLSLGESDSDEGDSNSWRLLWRRGQQERKELELELRREFAIAKTLSTEQRWLVVWADAKRKVETRRIRRLKASGAQQEEIEEEQCICAEASMIVEGKLRRLRLSKCLLY